MIGDAIDRAADRVSDRASDIAQQYAMKAIFGVLLFVFFLGVLVCGCIAAFWMLLPTYGPMVSIGIVAGGLGVLALLFLFAFLSAGRKVTFANTVKPVQVVKEETHEVVDTVGPYKFVGAALAAGAMLGNALGGSSRNSDKESDGGGVTGTVGSILSFAPTALSALTLFQSTVGNQAPVSDASASTPQAPT